MNINTLIHNIRLNQLLALVISASLTAAAWSNPVLDNVAAGNVNVGQTSNQTTITQTTQQGIVNWTSFNIAPNETTQFIQPNSAAITLNRINPNQGASQIYGALNANGKIILINGAGIHFGPSAMVNVGGIIASTADMTNANFLAGNFSFNLSSMFGGSISNEGHIIAANNGLVALIGQTISNTGLIQAQLGNIILASGNTFTFAFDNDQLINFAVNDANDQGHISNQGTLLANGGTILVTAKTAKNVLDNVIDMEGIAEANSVSEHNGSIILDANDNSILVNGTLTASGRHAGENGGSVKVLGKQVILGRDTQINVNGDSGGGEILIGGNTHGAGPEHNASRTYVNRGAILSASAVNTGNGGKVVVWADDLTRFAGNIFVNGGANGGNGGFSEVSGKQTLQFAGNISLNAPKGQVGQLLLDPANITIGASSNSSLTDFDNNNPATYSPSQNDSYINFLTLENLLANANVTITTGNSGSQLGDITLDGSVGTLAWTSSNTLTLNAANRIFLNSDITAVNGGLSLSAADMPQSVTSGNENNLSITGVTANVSVNNFNLLQGQWYQVNNNLPTFTANNFQLVSGAAVPNGVEFLRALAGNGSIGNEYQLADVYGLQGIASSSRLLSSNYVLHNDIDASSTLNWNSGLGFIPIGEDTNFSANFNGQGHRISNLYINTGYTNYNVGLFANVDNTTGTQNAISNLTLANLNLTTESAGYVGGLVGYNGAGATLNNITVTGSVTETLAGSTVGGIVGFQNGGLISNASNLSNVTLSAAGNLGGIAGVIDNNGTLTNSYNTGVITGGFTSGGLVGLLNSGLITLSFNTGLVTSSSQFIPGGFSSFGGIAGGNFALITQVYNTGRIFIPITDQQDLPLYVGGITGSNFNTVTESYNTGTIYEAGGLNGGGISGQNYGLVDHVFNTGLIINTYGNVGTLNGEDVYAGQTSNSFFDVNTSGLSTAIGYYNNGDPNNTTNISMGCLGGSSCGGSDLSAQATFANAGFDFTNVWGIIEGSSYPYLKALVSSNPRVITGTLSGYDQNVSVVANGIKYTAQTAADNSFYFFIPNVIDGSPILTYLDNAGGNTVLSAPINSGSITGLSDSNYTTNTLAFANNAASTVSVSSLISLLGYNSNADIFFAPTNNNIVIGNSTNPDINLYTTANTDFILDGSILAFAQNGNSQMSFNGNLNTSGKQTILANGDLTLNQIIWQAGDSLTLSAFGNINFDSSSVANVNNISLIARADTSGQGAGTIQFNNSSNLNFSGDNNVVDLYYNPTVFLVPTLSPLITLSGNNSNLTEYMLINVLGNANDTTSRSLASVMNASGAWNKNFALAKNIDASASSSWNNGAGFIPLGDNITNFTGNFNGFGYIINNLTINRPSTNNVGLFGYASGGTISNLGLVNANITGNNNTGGLIGYSINNTVNQAFVGGQVNGNNNTGGLIGNSLGSMVSSSYNQALVSSTGNNVGGFTGYSTGTLANNYNLGNVVISNATQGANVGGFAGYASGNISNSYSIGYLMNANASSNSTGSFIGTADSLTTMNNYWNSDTAGNFAGVGHILTGTANGVSSLTTSSLQANLPSGFSSANWAILPNISYPYLKSLVTSNPRVISGNLGSANSAIGVITNGMLNTVRSGNNGAYYLFIPNLADNSPLLILANGGNTILSLPNNNGSILAQNSFAQANSIAIADGALPNSNSILSALLGNINSSDILFKANGNDLTLGNSLHPNVNLIVNSQYLLDGNINSYNNSTTNLIFNKTVNLLSNSNFAITAGSITFNDAIAIDGDASLTLSSAIGTTLNGAAGYSNYLYNLTLTGGGTDFLNANVMTSGNQRYLNDVVLGSTDIQMNSSNILFNKNLSWTGSNQLTLAADSYIYFNGNITALNGSLNLSAFSGSQNINGISVSIGSGSIGIRPTSLRGAVNLANFYLQHGQWYQNALTLPDFKVGNDFTIASGSRYNSQFDAQFTRLSTRSSVNYITDIYGLQGIGGASLTTAYQLANNIDATATLNWNAGSGFTPIANGNPYFYNGNFSGNNYTIKNLYIFLPGQSNVGIFGNLGPNAKISNLNIVNANISGGYNTGGLAGFSRANLISNVYVNAQVTGYDFGDVGGLMGQMYSGTINNVSTSGLVRAGTNYFDNSIGGLVGYVSNLSTTTITNSSSSATVDTRQSPGSRAIGGLIGYIDNQGASFTLKDSFATGTVYGSDYSYGTGGLVGQNFNTISNVYATGYVTGGSSTGGLIGQNGGTVTNGYWDYQTSGQQFSDGGVGMSTAAMQAGLPTGFLSTKWSIVAGNGVSANGSYPYLLTQYQSAPVVISGFIPGGAENATGLGGTDINIVSASKLLGQTIGAPDKAQTGDNGFFYFLEAPTAFTNQSPLMVYSSSLGATIVSNYLGNALTGLNLVSNTLQLGTNQTGTLSNTALASLQNGRSINEILFHVDSANLLNLKLNTNLMATANTTYDLAGGIQADPNSTGTLTFEGPVALSSDAVVSAGGGDVTMHNVNGANNLTINSDGAVKIEGTVGGSTPLASLHINSSTPIQLNGLAVSTTGGQQYTGDITLGANVIFNSLNNGNINFDNLVNGNGFNLSTNTGGITTFHTVTGVNNLAANGIGQVSLFNDIATAGNQYYGGALNLAGNTQLVLMNGGNLSLNGLSGNYNLTVLGDTNNLSSVEFLSPATLYNNGTYARVNNTRIDFTNISNFLGNFSYYVAPSAPLGTIAAPAATVINTASSVSIMNTAGIMPPITALQFNIPITLKTMMYTHVANANSGATSTSSSSSNTNSNSSSSTSNSTTSSNTDASSTDSSDSSSDTNNSITGGSASEVAIQQTVQTSTIVNTNVNTLTTNQANSDVSITNTQSISTNCS